MRSHSTLFVRLGAVALLPFLMACAKQGGDSSGPTVTPQTPELEYKGSSPISYPEPTTLVTATAAFDRYVDGAGGLQTIATAQPIRYAEVQILDANGALIQSGETDGSGAISLRIPRATANYTLRVNSRAFNSRYKASVLQDPYSNTYYSLDTSFSNNGAATKSVAITPAPATNGSSVLGAAFNILDQVYLANEFLRANAYSASCPVCVDNFTVAPKSQIYWRKGISPAVYYGQPTSPISFFLAEASSGVYPGIYMLGGIENDLCTDTDHFDRSVILHEYGHFLEHAFGKSASPGGSHDGNSLIDPRLAWSEGWADFFQAAVLGRNYYRDTKRNAGCAAGASLSFSDFNLELKGGTDVPLAKEGIFREISIARTLYDVMTPSSSSTSPNLQNTVYGQTSAYTVSPESGNPNKSDDAYAANIGFSLIWHSFTSLSNATYKFQNMGQLNMLNTAVVNASYPTANKNEYASVLSNEAQVSTQTDYGLPLRPQSVAAGSCSYSFVQGEPTYDANDPVHPNDFYRYDYDGNPANGKIYLRYQRSGGTFTRPYDLDIYIYPEKHTLGDASDVVVYSEKTHPEGGGSPDGPGFEFVDLSGRAAGTYLINVSVYANTSRATTSYYLETHTGAQLCP